jgi:septation ring formation regulator EzrA
MSELQRQTVQEIIKVYLPLTIAIVGAAVTWGMFTARLSANEDRISAIESKQQKLDETLSGLRTSVAVIERSVTFIEKQYK